MGKKPRRKSRRISPGLIVSTPKQQVTKRRSIAKAVRLHLPHDQSSVDLKFRDRTLRLTNLQKLFWPQFGITKGELLQYYADVAPVILPHLRQRAMVMKRYPGGANGPFFFMKRAPLARPKWIDISRSNILLETRSTLQWLMIWLPYCGW